MDYKQDLVVEAYQETAFGSLSKQGVENNSIQYMMSLVDVMLQHFPQCYSPSLYSLAIVHLELLLAFASWEEHHIYNHDHEAYQK